MIVSNERFPALGLICNPKQVNRKLLPFSSKNKERHAFIKKSREFVELFQSFSPEWSLEEKDKNSKLLNYVVCENLTERIRTKRRLSPSNFIRYLARDQQWYGGMVMTDLEKGFHYVYRIASLPDQGGNRDASMVYFKIGSFKNATFLGFEEGMVHQDGETQFQIVIHGSNTRVGDYLYYIGALFRHIERYKMTRPLPKNIQIHEGDFEFAVLQDDQG